MPRRRERTTTRAEKDGVYEQACEDVTTGLLSLYDLAKKYNLNIPPQFQWLSLKPIFKQASDVRAYSSTIAIYLQLPKTTTIAQIISKQLAVPSTSSVDTYNSRPTTPRKQLEPSTSSDIPTAVDQLSSRRQFILQQTFSLEAIRPFPKASPLYNRNIFTATENNNNRPNNLQTTSCAIHVQC
ncbi:hypothetical protein QE152_g39571 [Popillia japonica]|uniref:Uncharacterized protein n=1 Tax=Popillia japonica TaxID=7064 RepID=A0AAW1HTM1_POPJA